MKKRNGFTLMELSMVILCISILLGVGVYATDTYIQGARETQAKADIAVLASAVSRYHLEQRIYPGRLQDLLIAKASSGAPYILPQTFPKTDPWGTTTGINGKSSETSPYAYVYTSEGVAIWSFGRDKTNVSGGDSGHLPPAIVPPNIGIFIQ